MKKRFQGFTLIELLVVIAIVALLIGLIQPAIVSSQKRMKRMKVEGDLQSLVSGWKAYFGEYGRWPILSGQCLGQDASESGAGIEMRQNILTYVLLPSSRDASSTALRTYNPKRIQFLVYDEQVINEDGQFVDPWGNMIRVLFDLNVNGKIDRVSLPLVYENVIAWSAGPDGKFGTSESDPAFEDDILSWD